MEDGRAALGRVDSGAGSSWTLAGLESGIRMGCRSSDGEVSSRGEQEGSPFGGGGTKDIED